MKQQGITYTVSDRTPEDKAIIKFHADAAFAAQFDYDYQDEWDQP